MTKPYAGGLTPEELDAIADRIAERVVERAADRAIEKITARFGLGVLKRISYFIGSLIGTAVLGLIFWLANNGGIKP